MQVRRIASTLVVALGVGLPACSPSTPAPEVPNPDLSARCGLDVNLVVDRSGSIGAENTTVQKAAQTLVDALVGTPSRVRLASFSSTALVHPGGDALGTSDLGSWQWEPVAGFAVPVLPSGGGTNVEGGLEVVRRGPGPVGALTVLFTDGVPNERYLVSPDGHPGIYVGDADARPEARDEANMLKALGTHVLAIGVGDADVSVLRELSGPDDLAAGGVVEAADYLEVGSFGDLVTAFRSMAQRMCASTLSVTKVLVDSRGVETVGVGWTFEVTLDRATSMWNQPKGGSGASGTIVTGSGGTATAAWVDAQQSEASVIEHQVFPYELDSVSCTSDRFDGAGRQPVAVTRVESGFRVPVGGQVAVYCRVVNRG